MSSVNIAVILPSRGLIFSQTAEEILNELKGIKHKIFFSHRKPLPDCFEDPLNKALENKSFTHIWFVEDDMVIKPGTLKKLIDADVNAVTIDYPINEKGGGSVFFDAGGNIIFCGTGCLLVKSSVFKGLKKPYFTDKVSWTPLNYGESIRFVGKELEGEYGGHDITFCFKLWNNGVKINVIPGKLYQRKLIELGKSGSNNGQHKIKVWKKLIKNYHLKEIQAQPVALGTKSKLVTVDTPSGGVTLSRKHADSLVEQGMASYPPRRFTIIDDSEVEI